MYDCESCGKSFNRLSRLREHKNRKFSCHYPTHRCSYCNKGFSGYRSCWNHKQRCKVYKNKQSDDNIDYQTLSETSPNEYHDDCNSNGDAKDTTDYEYVTESDEESDEESENIATYAWRDDGSIKRNHCSLLPRNVRAIIVGKSGCGKTTFVTSLLLKPDVMDYNKLMVCGRSLHQPEYEVIRSGFDKGLSKNQVRTLFRKQDGIMEQGGVDKVLSTVDICKGGINASFFNDVEMIPDPTEHDASQRNLLVLDDVMLGPQNKVEAYFTRGRHNNVDVIYITQSYFRLPRHTIRENANLFIFFAQDGKNLVHIFHDHCSGDGISFDLFSAMCNDWWRQGKHNFITIDLSKPVNDGKYRKNFDMIWGYK